MPDDFALSAFGRACSDLKRCHSSRAPGANRIHAGSIGGQLAIRSAKVPSAFALEILRGTSHLDTYHAKRGESAGIFETA